MPTIQVYFPKGEEKIVKRDAKKAGISMAKYIRKAVEVYRASKQGSESE